MCGFSFNCCRNADFILAPDTSSQNLIKARGPDGYISTKRIVECKTEKDDNIASDTNLHLTFSASVLSLRSQKVISQPLVDAATGSLFMWNGEAWKHRGFPICGNDTNLVFRSLVAAMSESRMQISDQSVDEQAVLYGKEIEKVLANLEGPFAFLFYDAISHTIFYGRDILGRRSLLVSNSSQQSFTVASVSADTSQKWEEVETRGIHVLDLKTMAAIQDARSITSTLSNAKCVPWSSTKKQGLMDLNHQLVPPASSNQRYPSLATINEFQDRLLHSLKIRITSSIPSNELNGRKDDFAVMFSGGVDCTLIALLMDKILPQEHSIDLLNVAFENPRVISAATSARVVTTETDPVSAYGQCPDRRTGLSSYAQLQKLCPERQWRFVLINIPYAEVIQEKELVATLMHPHNTEMDFSIALALFFAARGRGELCMSSGNRSHVTRARVLFSGLGADEIFGGYSRHAKAFERMDTRGLIEELELDFRRIPKRNLGRDDRIISHWGREVRYPYLDENFVRWSLSLPVWEKCGFQKDLVDIENPASVEPGKLLLRSLAWKLGLESTALEKKRAIQFGARTAKMNKGRKKGTEVAFS